MTTDQPLVRDPQQIRLAMLGMVPGNGHPYSWSAIINGAYDRERMAASPYPVIAQYLGAQPPANLGIPGAQVTHVWCDDPADTERVAAAVGIPHPVAAATEVLGEVDAVIIATDIGGEHVARARPFLEAGLPVFIDKPLTDREDHLQQFVAWRRAGRHFLSTSGLRYAREYADCQAQAAALGPLRLITATTPKSWDRYGIHILEGVYRFLEPGGWRSVVNQAAPGSNIVHARHASGAAVVLAAIDDLVGAFGCVNVYGPKGTAAARFTDTFYAFKRQLEVFIEYLRTGRDPMPFTETVELMQIIIAGIRSREQGGREVRLEEVQVEGHV